MNEMNERFDTPLPGELVPENEAAKLIDRFLLRFRTTDPAEVPSNIPTACVLDGAIDEQVLGSTAFKKLDQIFLFVEGAGLVCKTTPDEIIDYLSLREPWEVYDLCLFDNDLEWCIGLTHNEQVIVAGDLP
jgi:hypothetical protein